VELAVAVMDTASIRAKVAAIEAQREFLVKLLERPDLGLLTIDVNQAIEEMDELIAEFKQTFPAP
jgi:tRNA U34 5-carboxymethylaminomethyl modifying GTPase MnmE/TrmE